MFHKTKYCSQRTWTQVKNCTHSISTTGKTTLNEGLLCIFVHINPYPANVENMVSF